MPRVGDVFQLLSGTLAVPNTTIQSAPYNAQQNDWVTEANSPRPISAGGTGETTAEGARTELGAIGVGDLSGADTKAVVVETDSVVIIDSEDDNTNKRWLVSDITAYMRTISPPTGLNRNRLVNGAFQINQENPGTTVSANGDYPVDQWKITRTVTPGVISCEQRTDGDPYALQLQPSIDQPTIGSGVWHISQTIEGNRTSDFHWPFLSGSPAVLRVRVNVNIAGTFGFFIRNNPATHTYVGTFTLGAEEVGEWVEKIIPIPVPPLGSTWATNTSAGITVGFTMAAAAANLAATAGWSASSSVYGVTGQVNLLNIGGDSREISFSAVALYSDPDSTGVAPKWEMPDEAEELRACQRYWWKGSSADSLGYRYASTVTTFWDAGTIPFPAQMRAAPTVAVLLAPIYVGCSTVSPNADTNNAALRVTTLGGPYRAYSGVYSFNARL